MSDAARIRELIRTAPDEPGVYLMKDSSSAVIYVGKARSLRKRLTSYIGRGLDAKTVALMASVRDIECRLTPTESLALLLESSLIHQYKPRYNIALRDDKSFPMVKITGEEFPAVCVTRKKESDGARYYGPYINAGLLRDALRIIRRHFPYRSCATMPKRACMYHRIGLSPAPCIGAIGKTAYRRTIRAIGMILDGKTDRLAAVLTRQMRAYSRARRFEEAAAVRDQLMAVQSLGYKASVEQLSDELRGLQDALGLKALPERIEAFDISNIRGQEATGSMVSFWHGRPDKDNYRRFRIKTVAVIDDYRMLDEVIHRRYRRLKAERRALPDLILVDGGKGHLAAALRRLSALDVVVPVISLAKEHEHVYVPLREQPLELPAQSPALKLLCRVRDEAHRFAVSYHRVLRRKKILGN